MRRSGQDYGAMIAQQEDSRILRGVLNHILPEHPQLLEFVLAHFDGVYRLLSRGMSRRTIVDTLFRRVSPLELVDALCRDAPEGVVETVARLGGTLSPRLALRVSQADAPSREKYAPLFDRLLEAQTAALVLAFLARKTSYNSEKVFRSVTCPCGGTRAYRLLDARRVEEGANVRYLLDCAACRTILEVTPPRQTRPSVNCSCGRVVEYQPKAVCRYAPSLDDGTRWVWCPDCFRMVFLCHATAPPRTGEKDF